MRPPDTTGAGWRDDPRRSGAQRYWDGERWTAMSRVVSPDAAPRSPRRRRTGIVVATVVVVVLVAAAAGLASLATRGGAGSSVSVRIAAGDAASCVLVDGAVRCWGGAAGGEGGPRVVLRAGATDLAGGGTEFCAARADAPGTCWSDQDPTPGPGTPAGLEQVAVSTDHGCGVRAGEVLCWGDPSGPQLGAEGGGGRTVDASDAVVVGVGPATQVAVAPGRSCAVLRSGEVWCWGVDTTGGPPRRVPGVQQATAVAVSAAHACAIVSDGVVECWGRNDRGQLGVGTADETGAVPAPVVGLSDATAVAAGEFSTCAVLRDGSVWCWGDGGVGQLGNGERSGPRRQPVRVELDDVASDVAVGRLHACAVSRAGVVWCWGAAGDGQLGPGQVRSEPSPVRVRLEG